jgi:hypothetical protein
MPSAVNDSTEIIVLQKTQHARVQVSRISIPAMFPRSVESIKDTVPTRHSQHEGGKKPKTLLSNQTKQKTALTIAIR